MRTDCGVNATDCSSCSGPSEEWVVPVVVPADGRCYPVSVTNTTSNVTVNTTWFTVTHGGNVSAMFSSPWMNVNCAPPTPAHPSNMKHKNKGWIAIVIGVGAGVFVLIVMVLFIVRARKRSSQGDGYGFLQDGY